MYYTTFNLGPILARTAVKNPYLKIISKQGKKIPKSRKFLETTSKFHGSSPHFRRAPPRLRQSPPTPEASPTPTQAACGADGARDSRASAPLHTRRAARCERTGPQHPNEPHESVWRPPVAPSRPQTALRSAPGGRRGRRPASSRAHGQQPQKSCCHPDSAEDVGRLRCGGGGSP